VFAAAVAFRQPGHVHTCGLVRLEIRVHAINDRDCPHTAVAVHSYEDAVDSPFISPPSVGLLGKNPRIFGRLLVAGVLYVLGLGQG